MAIVICLAAVGLLNQVGTTRHWSQYTSIYRQILAERHGFVAWNDLMQELPPADARVMRRMNFNWTNPSMSILLSPHGKVRSLILNPPGAWQQWDPANPAKWPRPWFYDTSGFPMDERASDAPR